MSLSERVRKAYSDAAYEDWKRRAEEERPFTQEELYDAMKEAETTIFSDVSKLKAGALLQFKSCAQAEQIAAWLRSEGMNVQVRDKLVGVGW